MRVRLLTRLSNAFRYKFRVWEKRGRFSISAWTNRNCRPPDRGTYKTPRNEISLPLICIIQRARERGGRILRVESCVLEGEVGGNGLNYDPPRNLWIGGRREAAGECARFAVNFFFFFFFFFFLVFLTSLRFCLRDILFVKSEEFRGGRVTGRQSYRWYKSNDAIKV